MITRRRFVEGLAATGLAAHGLSRAPRPCRCSPAAGSTSRSAPCRSTSPAGRGSATAVNGSVPGADPALARRRHGDAQRAQPLCARARSIHWHGLSLAERHGRRAGPHLPRHRARRDLHLPLPGPAGGHLLVSQPLRHSRSRPAFTARSILEPRGARALHAIDRDYVVMLSDWTDEEPMTIVCNLKFQSDYYNFASARSAPSSTTRSATACRRRSRTGSMWGKMRMSPTDILDVTRRHLHLPDERPAAGGQLDGAVRARRDACACASSTARR